jgi:putative DNA primase/helicase
MLRSLPEETRIPARQAALKHLEPLRRKVARWVSDSVDQFGAAKPAMPAQIQRPRAQDNWEPLFAIADVAGGHLPARARQAGVDLHTAGQQRSSPTPTLDHDLIRVSIRFFVEEIWGPDQLRRHQVPDRGARDPPQRRGAC